MFSFNKVVLVGHLGKDPEIKTISNGNSSATFSVAVSSNYKDKQGQWVNNSDWYKILTFSDFAVKATEKYLKKGSKVLIEGKLQKNKYKDKSGIDRESVSILASNIVILDKIEKNTESNKNHGFDQPLENYFNDEIPF